MDNDCLNRNVSVSAKEYQCIKERLSDWRRSFKFSKEALAKMRKKRKHTDNMRKPKTRTAALIAEQERRKALGFFKGENNPLYGSHFAWYNDGVRNYRIASTDNTDGLTKGKLQKKRVKYELDGKQFTSLREIHAQICTTESFSTWKRRNAQFIDELKRV